MTSIMPKEKEGVELGKPDLFKANPRFSTDLWYRQAMAQYDAEDEYDIAGYPRIITLPHSFSRVLREVIEPLAI